MPAPGPAPAARPLRSDRYPCTRCAGRRHSTPSGRAAPARSLPRPHHARVTVGSSLRTSDRSPLTELLVLWDIDHTLVDAAGVGVEAFIVAFRRLFGRDPLGLPVMSGRTDRAIVTDTL